MRKGFYPRKTMIACPVCQAENDDFATTCKACKAFIQNRIPNLDLFQTLWNIIESPRSTFHQIVLAEHKNFSLFLFTLFGISLSFTAFWYFKLGNRFESLFDLIGWALMAGIAIGLATAVLLTAIYHLIAKLLGGSSSLRNSFAVLAYSSAPIIGSLVFILPIELLTFGMFLFTSNPHPYTIKPISYVVLIGFDTAVAIWSIVLAMVGTMVSHKVNFLKSVFVVMIAIGITGMALFAIASSLRILNQ